MEKKQSCSKLLEMARKQIKNDIENVDQKLGKKLEEKRKWFEIAQNGENIDGKCFLKCWVYNLALVGITIEK